MRQSFGISGVVLAILGLSLAPPLNLFLLWGALILCTLAALAAGRMLPATTVAAATIELGFLSPLTLEMLLARSNAGLALVTALALLAPIAAIVLNAAGKLGCAVRPPETYADVFERGW